MFACSSSLFLRLSARLDNAWGLAAGFALPPLAATAALAAVLGAHEHTQAAGPTFVQCWNAGLGLREQALACGGRFQPPGAQIQRRIESRLPQAWR
jgi:hypothetical protein